MLWQYQDMQAGYFPENWFSVMLTKGFVMGLQYGWMVIMLSFPYNIITSVLGFYVTTKGSEICQ
jgi:hypothetical protein